jgi:hypothetical protein
MKATILGSLLVVAAGLTAAPARAHHSAAALYRLDEQMTIQGVVTRFTLGNPHVRVYLTVKGEDGGKQQWMAEGGSRTVLLSKGWTADEVHAGDVVKIVGNPSRDGSKILHMQKLVLPNGRALWSEDLNPRQLKSLRERRNAARNRREVQKSP